MNQEKNEDVKQNVLLAVFIFLILFLFAGLIMYIFLSRPAEYIPSGLIAETPSPEIGDTKEVSFETIDIGSQSSISEKGNYIIKNDAELKEFLAKFNSDRIYKASPFTADFSKEIIVAVFQGEKNSGGYSIEIYKIAEDQNNVNVFVKEVSPGADCMVTAVMTQPYHIVKFKKTGKNIKFIPERETISCKKTLE